MTAPLTFEVAVEHPAIDVVITPVVVNTVVVAGPTGLRGVPGPGVNVVVDTITGDNVTTTFPLSQDTIDNGSVQAFRNGLTEVSGVGFIVGYNEGSTVTFTTAPLSDDVVVVRYHVEGL